MNEISQTIGSAFIDTYGKYCLEAVRGGYNLDELYNAGSGWGDFSRVLLAVAKLHDVKSYGEYLVWHESLQVDQKPVSVQLFSRFTGIKSFDKRANQATYNERYRLKTLAELQALRQATALKWIDENLAEATTYIENKKVS